MSLRFQLISFLLLFSLAACAPPDPAEDSDNVITINVKKPNKVSHQESVSSAFSSNSNSSAPVFSEVEIELCFRRSEDCKVESSEEYCFQFNSLGEQVVSLPFCNFDLAGVINFDDGEDYYLSELQSVSLGNESNNSISMQFKSVDEFVSSNIGEGVYSRDQTVYLQRPNKGETLYYSFDCQNYTLYDGGPINIQGHGQDVSLCLKIEKDGFEIFKKIRIQVNYNQLSTPSDPLTGDRAYFTDRVFQIISDNTGDIRYTLDGSDPDENSTLYTAPLTFDSPGIYQIKYSTFADQMLPSTVQTKSFSIYGFVPEAYIKPRNNAAENYFGKHISSEGDRMVVGAIYEDSSQTSVTNGSIPTSPPGGQSNSGAVYVFRKEGANWVDEAYIKTPNTYAGALLGYYTAISGNRIALGAEGDESDFAGILNGSSAYPGVGGPSESGAVYIYRKEKGNWIPEAFIKHPTPQASDRFGGSVDLDGDTLVVSAYQDHTDLNYIINGGYQTNDLNALSEVGTIFVYKRNGYRWDYEAQLAIPNPTAGDKLRYFDLDGDTIAVGVWSDDSSTNTIDYGASINPGSGNSNSGAVYIYDRVGTTWSLSAFIKAPNTGVNDDCGRAISLDGDTLAVGCEREDGHQFNIVNNSDLSSLPADSGGADDSGAVYVYKRTGATWALEAYIKASNGEADDRFGGKVFVEGDLLAVSASLEDGGTAGVTKGDQANEGTSVTDSAAVYVYQRINGKWTQVSYIKPPNNQAGINAMTYSWWVNYLSLNDGDLFVSNNYDDGSLASIFNGNYTTLPSGANDSGAVYAYKLSKKQHEIYIYPYGRTYDEDQAVTLEASDGTSTIYYTTDGTDPSTSSAVYSSPIIVAGDGTSVTIKALMVKDGINYTSEQSYQVTYPTVDTPSFSLKSGTHYFAQSTDISTLVTGTTIYYTLDGSDPITSSTVNTYSGPINLIETGDHIIKAYATRSGFHESPVSSINFEIRYLEHAVYFKDNRALTHVQDGRFANVVKLNNDLLVIGEENDFSTSREIQNGGAFPSSRTGWKNGSVYVYRRDGNLWKEDVFLQAFNSDTEDRFGSDVDVENDTIVVSARSEESPYRGVYNGARSAESDGFSTVAAGDDEGAVYVYRRKKGIWDEEAYIKPLYISSNNYAFGHVIDLDSNSLAASFYSDDSNQAGITNGTSYSDNDSMADSGSVLVYFRTGDLWEQQAYIRSSSPSGGDRFGLGLSLDGDTLAVASDMDDSSGNTIQQGSFSIDDAVPDSGAVYIFDRSGNNWSQSAFIKAPNSVSSLNFGRYLTLVGDILIVGVPLEDNSANGISYSAPSTNAGATDSGAIYVYKRTSGTWGFEAYIKAHNAEANDLFGNYLDFDGKILAVSAYQEGSDMAGIYSGSPNTNNNVLNSGAVYLFERHEDGTWEQISYIKPSNNNASYNNDYFGRGDLFVTDRYLGVPAPYEDHNSLVNTYGMQTEMDNGANNPGAVYLYEFKNDKHQIIMSPHPNEYDFGQEVKLTSSDGSSIYFTIDGTEPTTNSTNYSAPIIVTGDQSDITIKALISNDDGEFRSEGRYILNY